MLPSLSLQGQGSLVGRTHPRYTPAPTCSGGRRVSALGAALEVLLSTPLRLRTSLPFLDDFFLFFTNEDLVVWPDVQKAQDRKGIR